MGKQTGKLITLQPLTGIISRVLALSFTSWYQPRELRKVDISLSQKRAEHDFEPDIAKLQDHATTNCPESSPNYEYERAVLALAREFPFGDFENWEQCQQLLPCVQSLYERRACFGSTIALSLAWGQILTNTAWYLWRQGYYQEAQKYVFDALPLRQSVLGRDHEHTLITLEVATCILMSLDQHEEAEAFSRRALEGFRRTLGDKHPSTLTSVSNLALILHQQGRYEDAEIFGRWAMNGSRVVLGKLHADTLKSVSNLGLILRQQGKYKEATRLSKKAFDGFSSTIGKDHPSTLTSMTNLAIILERRGKLRSSQALLWQAIFGKIRVLGVDHPSTLVSLSHVKGTKFVNTCDHSS